MDPRNPFAISYLTEASLSPDQLLDRYSFKPFDVTHEAVSQTSNIFLVGRNGVGKTMLLRIFDPQLMKLILCGTTHELLQVRRALPPATVGVYLNLGAPIARVAQFRGPNETGEYWSSAFGDYLNWVLFAEALGAVDAISSLPAWRDAAGATTPILTNRDFVADLLERLRHESSDFDRVRSLEQLRALARDRIVGWTRFVNRDPQQSNPPPGRLPLGVPLFHLVDSIRRAADVQQPFRLFVLIDQYEILYQERNAIDFRPLVNKALYLASRGGTGVEFKIGTRPYAYGNLSLPGEGGRLQSSREFLEVNLDRYVDEIYPAFAGELFRKRMSVFSQERMPKSAPASFFPRLTAEEEGDAYVRGEARDMERHISPFVRAWEALGVSRADCHAIVANCELRGARPLHAVLACIGITRWLEDPSSGVPVGCSPVGGGVVESGSAYLRQLLLLVAERYRVGTAAASRGVDSLRRVDNFVRDTEEGALFQLASYHKNQKRIYAGFENLVTLSSNVALVLIEILRAAFDRLILSGRGSGGKAIEPRWQSEAVYRVAESWFNRIPKDCDFGEAQHRFLRGLGLSMRLLQLHPAAPNPSPNGFSVEEKPEQDSERSRTPRDDAVVLLKEAVGWGLLEEDKHNDKTRGRARRRKFRLNRIFCPYFGLTINRKKDPVYVADLDRFVAACRAGSVPEEIRRQLLCVEDDDGPSPTSVGPTLFEV